MKGSNLDLLMAFASMSMLNGPSFMGDRGNIKHDPVKAAYNKLTNEQLKEVREWTHKRFEGEDAKEYEFRMKLREYARKRRNF